MSVYDFTVKTRKGEDFSLSALKGRILLIVNTATGCGFTPQYEGLENLYRAYHENGLEILDFPCNQFGHQALGEDDEIHEFCTAKYQTTFDQFKKIDVNGETAIPLFAWLKEQAPEDEEPVGLKNKAAMAAIKKISKTCVKPNDVKWNFTKFLVDREGNVVKRWGPTADPASFTAEIEKLL
jgi:glutathione peroxidase